MLTFFSHPVFCQYLSEQVMHLKWSACVEEQWSNITREMLMLKESEPDLHEKAQRSKYLIYAF